MLPRPTESLHPVQKIKNKKQQPGFYKEKNNNVLFKCNKKQYHNTAIDPTAAGAQQ